MNKKREEAQKYILKYIDRIAPGGKNKTLYENMFKRLSDKEFDVFMMNLRDKKQTMSIIVPNGSDIKIDVKKNFKIGKELGYEFFQHLHIDGDRDLPPYKTPNKYLVYKLPIKRASQLLSKKISIPKDEKSMDLTTGQVTGKSRASKITMPEIQLLTSMGLESSVKELLKYRGGDLGSKRVMAAALYKTGQVNEEVLDAYGTGVVSTKTLKSYFLAAHIKSTL